MAFLAFDDDPGQRQGSSMVDDADHEGDAATTDDAAINGHEHRLVGQVLQQRLGDRQKPAIQRVRVVFEPAPEACDDTFLGGSSAGRMISDRGQVCAVTAGQAADQGDQRIQMAFAMAGERRQALHQGSFYGSLAAIRVTHNAPPD